MSSLCDLQVMKTYPINTKLVEVGTPQYLL